MKRRRRIPTLAEATADDAKSNLRLRAIFERVTPLWFEWLEWLLITGAVAFVAKATGDTLFRVVEWTCYGMLFFYFQYYIFVAFEPLSRRVLIFKSPATRVLGFTVTVLVNTLVLFGSRYLIVHAIDQLRDSAPR